MIKSSKKNMFFLLLVTCVFIFMFPKQAFAENAKSRIYGNDRIKTSIEVSKSGWESGSDYVVIVQGYNCADAICAAPLAKKYDAPILLTERLELNDDTISELKRLKAKNVIVFGGPSVVSEKVEEQLKSINIKGIQRIYGSTRYETALKAAYEMGKTDTVFIANGEKYPDSLSAVSIAAAKGAPILFTKYNTIDSSIKEYLVKNNISNVYVIGGEGAISENVIKMLPNSQRISGKNRYETNIEVIDKFIEDISFEKVYIVRGDGIKENEFSDVLSVSSLAGKKFAPVVLSYGDVDKNTEAFIKSQIISRTELIAIGGEKIIPSEVLRKLSSSFEKIEITKVNEILGDEKTVKDIKKDVLVEANNVTLRNLNIEGVLTLNPGEKGSVDVKNVNCKVIEIKSGDKNSIHLSGVKAEKIIVDSVSNVRLELSEGSHIKNTEIKSSSILDNKNGSFGNIVIPDSNSKQVERNIELRGKFKNPILVNGQANLHCKDRVAEIKVNSRRTNSRINISGYADIINIAKGEKVVLSGVFSEVNADSDSKIEVASSSRIGKLALKNEAQIDVQKGAQISKLEKSEASKVKDNNNKDAEKEEKPNPKKDKDENNNGSNNNNNNNNGTLESILKQTKGDFALEVKALGNNKISMEVVKKNGEKSNVINITLYNDKNELVYIGQKNLNSSRCEFNTVLESGEYRGYYAESNANNKTEINRFKIK